MNHKRGKSKNQRSGCLMCKFWKINGYSKYRNESEQMSSHKERLFSKKDLKDYEKEEF